MKHLIAITLTIFNAWFFYDVGKHKGATEALERVNQQAYGKTSEKIYVRPAYKIIDGKRVAQRYGRGDGSDFNNAYSGIQEFECKEVDWAKCWVIKNIYIEGR